MRTTTLAVVALVVLTGTTACQSTSGGTEVAVTGTNDACTPATTELAAGKTTFVFTNEADEVSELYVLRDDNSVVSEVENVTTGLERTLTVDLSAGTYVLNCKPGQAGEGFRTTITVTGEGGESAPATGREIEIVGRDYAFDGVPTGLAAGETITFELENDGLAEHELEVFGPDGEAIGEVGPTPPGQTGKVTLTLDEAGTYRLVCGIDDHESLGMVAELEVNAA
jgi:uncharacterized cupredoxin-like copper-binding protein